jgi:thioredoxin reductase
VAVIGAGAAGLITGKELVDLGHRVEIFEQSPGLGGVWNYSPETEDDLIGLHAKRKRVHGSMYANLRTNLPREVMGVSDYPFDTAFPGSSDPRTYCSHQEVLRYLQAYAEHFDVVKHVRFSTPVVSVQPEWNKDAVRHWTVTTGADQKRFDAVVVCNGHYSEPRVPTYEGQDVFKGIQIHSHNYRRPEGFAGKRVVVIGAAFSGSDISQELLEHGAESVFLSGRNWEDLASGSEARRQVIKVPDVRRLLDTSIEFVDGHVVENVDVVMYATGYLYSFPFFNDSSVPCRVIDNRVENLYKHVFLPRLAPSLSLIGIPWKVVPFPLFQLQAKWVGMCLNGSVTLPSEGEMMKDIEDMYETLGNLPRRYTHRFDADSQGAYAKWLAGQCGNGTQGWPDWRRDMYLVSGMNRRTHGIDFREYDLKELGAGPAYETFAHEADIARQQWMN